jgi:hypothetical protein
LPSLIPVPDWVPVVSGIKLIVPSFNGAPFHVTFPETAMRRGPLSQPTHASKPAASIKMPEITLRRRMTIVSPKSMRLVYEYINER